MAVLARFLISTWYCYILAIGVTSYFYDYKTNKLRQSLILQRYSLLINFLTLLLLPFYCLYGMEYMDFVNQKPLLGIVSRCNIISQSLMLFYIIASRYRNDKIFYSLIEELQLLTKDLTAASQDSSYMHLFYLKYMTMCYQNVTIYFCAIYINKTRDFNLEDILLNLYFLTIWNFLQGTVFSFFLTLMHFCRCFKILNGRLKGIQQICVSPEAPFLPSILDLIDALQLHRKLQQLLLQLINLYRFHIVVLLLTFMTTNITIGYMTFMFITSMDFSSLTVIFSVVSFLVKYFDIYLLVYCCDETLAQYAEGVFLLRDLLNGENSGEFVRMCEEFNLWHSLQNLKINICGMFNLDKTAAFGILAETIMQSIIVMQFDYAFK